jgi:hypothetical protein
MSDNDIDAEAIADRVADEIAGIWTGFAEAYVAEDRDDAAALWDRPGVEEYRKVVLASTIARVTLGVAETRLVDRVPTDRLEAVRDRIELALTIAADLAAPDAVVREAESLRTRLRVWVKAALTYDPRGTGDDHVIAPGDLGRAMARDFAVMVVFAARDHYAALFKGPAALTSEAGKAWAAMGIAERWAAQWVHTQLYLSARALPPVVAVATYRALTDVAHAEFEAIANMIVTGAIQGREPDDVLSEVDRYLDTAAKPRITEQAGRIVASAMEPVISPGENAAALISPSFTRLWMTRAEQSIEAICGDLDDTDRLREPGAVEAFVARHRDRLTEPVMARAEAYCVPEWGVETGRAAAVFAALTAVSDRAGERVIGETCAAVLRGERARGVYLTTVRAIEFPLMRWAADAVRSAVEPGSS